MLSRFAFLAMRAASTRAVMPVMSRTPAAAATTARYATSRFMSSSTKPFAVDAPDGDHDLQDLEESSEWAERAINVASVTEDADAITEMHDAVLGKTVFAVDGPDGEHDLENLEEHLAGVNRIIAQASVLEDADEVEEDHRRQEEVRKQSYETDFRNSKY